MGISFSRPQRAQTAQPNQYGDQQRLFRHGMRNRPLPPIPTQVTPPGSPVRPASPARPPVTLQLQALREEYDAACRRRDIKAIGELTVKIERQRLQDERDWRFARLQADAGIFAPYR